MGYHGLSIEVDNNDSNTYYLLADMMLDGCQPYRDNQFGQMPLMVYPIAFAYLVFGSGIWTGNLVALLSTGVTLIYVFLIGEHMKKYLGMIACIIMVTTSMSFHVYSHGFYGVFLSQAFILAATYYSMTKKKIVSGFLIVSSLLIRLNNLPFVFVLSLLNHKEKRYWMGVALTLPVWLYFFSMPYFIENAFLAHLDSPYFSDNSKLYQIRVFFESDRIIAVLGLLAIVFMVIDECRLGFRSSINLWLANKRPHITFLLFILFYVLAISFLGKIWVYYLTLLVSYLSLLIAYVLLKFRTSRVTILLILLILSVTFLTQGHYYNSIYSKRPADINLEIIRHVKDIKGNSMLGLATPYMPYIAIKADKKTRCSLFDTPSSFYGAYHHREYLNNMILEELDSVDIVFMNIGYFEDWRSKDVDYTPIVKKMIETGFYPSTILSDGRLAHLILWKKGRGTESFDVPNTKQKIYIFERYFSMLDDKHALEDLVSTIELAGKSTHIPDQLKGENMFNDPFLCTDPLFWPVKQGDLDVKQGCGLTTYSWLSSYNDQYLDFFYFTFKDDVINSFGKVTYDLGSGHSIYFELYGRSDYPAKRSFLSTYQQKTISDTIYSKLNSLINSKKTGIISSKEYSEKINELL